MYISKFPEIVIDRKFNSPNAQTANITVEQYYDLMHHTHKASDLLGGDGSSQGGGISEEDKKTIQELKTKIEELTTTINEQQKLIETQNRAISSLEDSVKTIGETAGFDIADWDVTKPGIQGPEGDTLGTIFGLNMKEIK